MRVLGLVLGVSSAIGCGSTPESASPADTDSSTSSGSGSSSSSDATDSDSESESSETSTSTGDGDGDGDPGTEGTESSGDGDGEPDPIESPLTFAYGDDPDQTLDLYLPAVPLGPNLAVVVLAHGGLWQGGDKLAFASLCESIVGISAGSIACASINYRLSDPLGGVCRGVGVDTYFEQTADFTRAYARLQELAATHGLDAAKFHVGGHSAGAQLAHTLNLRWSEFAPLCTQPGGCVPPVGAIGVEGIYDIEAWNAYDASYWNGAFACATRKAFGGPPGPEACVDDSLQIPCWHAGSPTWLTTNAGTLGLTPSADALLVHSPGDNWVDFAEAVNFGAALEAGFPALDVITVTDGSCGTGSHDAVLSDPALATCIVSFVSGA